MNKLSIGITIALLFGFCVIMWAADSVGLAFGKMGENIALGAIAVALLIGFLQAHKETRENQKTTDNKGNEDLK